MSGHLKGIHPVFHVSLLEPSKGELDAEPPPIEVEGEEEWEVEAVLDSKLLHGKLWYLVKWVGYSEAEKTWLPAANLANGKDLVEEFHKAYPENPNKNELKKRGAEQGPRGKRSTPQKKHR